MSEASMSRVAIITGSNSGIGLETARRLAVSGFSVVLNSFTDRAEDHELAAELARETGQTVVYRKADMADGDACRELVAWAGREYGSVDVLVNNAGIQHVAPVDEFPVEQWNRIIAINLTAAFHTTAVALPMMRRKGWGRIVNIASAHGLRASVNKSAYVAAKHGIVGLTKTVALETAGQGITCNAVCPGFVLTPIVETQIQDRSRELGLDRETTIRDVILAKQPSKQFATIGEIAAAAMYLIGDEAGSVTGTTISIDGGWTAQ
ncbi:MAG: 3-hydroxybutyrate dehydrogenase [Mesorhizobium sp.]